MPAAAKPLDFRVLQNLLFPYFFPWEMEIKAQKRKKKKQQTNPNLIIEFPEETPWQLPTQRISQCWGRAAPVVTEKNSLSQTLSQGKLDSFLDPVGNKCLFSRTCNKEEFSRNGKSEKSSAFWSLHRKYLGYSFKYRFWYLMLKSHSERNN